MARAYRCRLARAIGRTTRVEAVPDAIPRTSAIRSKLQEGVIAKRLDRLYRPGRRSRDWAGNVDDPEFDGDGVIWLSISKNEIEEEERSTVPEPTDNAGTSTVTLNGP